MAGIVRQVGKDRGDVLPQRRHVGANPVEDAVPRGVLDRDEALRERASADRGRGRSERMRPGGFEPPTNSLE
ncbi:MAG: hypothetical protein ACREMC_08160, partial [Gemmatimonadales bacterium]